MNTKTPEAVASNAELGKLYADRDHAAQGEHYLRHLDAMTREGLHAKSEIAGELAHRDIEIERLRGLVRNFMEFLEPMRFDRASDDAKAEDLDKAARDYLGA